MPLGPILTAPAPGNGFHADYVARVVAAFDRVTGGNLARETGLDPADLGRSAWEGDYALLTHRGDAEATLNYGNRFVLDQWDCDWDQLTAMPSRLTAPEEDRAERAAMMAQVAERGFATGYDGRRVSRTGRLFLIRGGIVWRLLDADGASFGVAAFFRTVTPL